MVFLGQKRLPEYNISQDLYVLKDTYVPQIDEGIRTYTLSCHLNLGVFRTLCVFI